MESVRGARASVSSACATLFASLGRQLTLMRPMLVVRSRISLPSATSFRVPKSRDPLGRRDSRTSSEHYLLDEGPYCPPTAPPLSKLTELGFAVSTRDRRRELDPAGGFSASGLM